jgi:phosphatidylserine/phosphatidylglycerophosphate/cardiolipin synthase-like enzyme
MVNFYASVDSASVEVLGGSVARHRLSEDLSISRSLTILAFTIELSWFLETFYDALSRDQTLIVADHRSYPPLKKLVRSFPSLLAGTWPANRYHHTKAILFPDVHVSWIGSHNLTRSSWWLGHNLSARFHSAPLSSRLHAHALETFKLSTKVLP